MKFKKAQGRVEFAGPAPLPEEQRRREQQDASEQAARGQAVASFYSSLVQTSGSRWVSGGTLQDPAGAGGVLAPPGIAGAADGAAAATSDSQRAPAAGEPSHPGMASAAASAELAAEQPQLQYAAPAGPAPRGGGGEQPPPPFRGQQLGQGVAARDAPAEAVRYGISRANVGYRLLKKAGWTEGTGLGAQEQGAAEPIQAFQQKGSLGLGYALQPPPKPPPAGGAAAEGQQAQRAQQQPKRPLPEDPLDKEDSTTKVKRVRQVMQAEADDRAGKAIARYIRLAFNDATGEPTRDSNPLLRRNHKLSATNPLL